MSTPDSTSETGPSEPPIVIAGPAMDPTVQTIQPGGGVVMSIELFWGRVRRGLLRTLRPGFVRRMAQTRQGERGPLPFEAIDPRDVKYYRNQPTYWWAEEDDAYAWRDSLPFVRAGLAELILLGGGSIVLGIALSLWWWPLGIPLAVIAVLIIWFFRNPHREIPTDHGSVVSPADGKLVQIEKVNDPELGPCVQFGIFLSIFNVHVNRASLPGRVVAVRYRPGKFLNALRPESAQENENFDVFLVDNEAAKVGSEPRTFRIRQITGQFARRIVCWVRPGDVLGRGEIFGMIKLGSRTELLIPDSPQLDLVAELNQKVCAGSTMLARYRHPLTDAPSTTETSTTETLAADKAKDSHE
ncbi:phosphatidylserine decarboxylase [Rubripirellula sp.]|jgi:phosphatidylserine decarboxylase|nr:phosphatidylserine decarboxylase [Planctomycetaceae bacterium]MDA9859477.1 phosphatidylserine decarboxylase [Rubripirellula sp.]